MVKRLLLVLAISLILGCAQESEKSSSAQYYSTSNGPVELLFPAGWRKNKALNPYDLQCFSRFRRMTTGVFLFPKEDLAEDLEPRRLLQFQIDDIRSKRKNFKVQESELVVRFDAKKLTTIVFSGEKDSSRYYYRFTLVEFDENPEEIVIVLQVAIPSYWTKHKPILEEITKSIRIKVDG